MNPEFKEEAEEKDKWNCCGKERLEFHRSEPRRGLPARAPKVKGSGVAGRREEEDPIRKPLGGDCQDPGSWGWRKDATGLLPSSWPVWKEINEKRTNGPDISSDLAIPVVLPHLTPNLP